MDETEEEREELEGVGGGWDKREEGGRVVEHARRMGEKGGGSGHGKRR